jgi:hypothetical protein
MRAAARSSALALALAACSKSSSSGATVGPSASSSVSAERSAPSASSAPADPFSARAAEVRRRLGPNFRVSLQGPFVVAGDSPNDVLQEQVKMLRWAVGLLKKDFFANEPAEPIDVFLFRDRESYERHARELYDEEPQSPYGYYMHERRALIMNISTGAGTLVHEIVHAFMVVNFPACPPWFNEGLASLFERPSELDGQIQGFPNWRQPILQAAIREHRTIPLSALFGLDGPGFYGDGSSVHYGMARYLLYWTQLKGLLPTFYREFLAHREEDPTGRATLLRVLREEDMAAFQARWEKWVLALAPPE